MSQVCFPTLPGLAWSVHKSPTAATRVATHVSGRSVRAALMAYPLWAFELTYEVLRADTLHGELQSLMGFFLDRQGRFDSFLFRDPGDCRIAGRLLGAGDGSRESFAFLHPLGTLGAPVGQVEAAGLNVYLDGALQDPASYAVTLPNTLVFASPPPDSVPVTADYGYCFVCCFDQDNLDFENFMHQLWTCQSVKFTSVKP